MRRRNLRGHRVAGVMLVITLLAGCTGSPVDSGAAGASGDPGTTLQPIGTAPASPAATAAPSAGGQLAIRWEPAPELSAMLDPRIVAAPDGFLVVGDCESDEDYRCPTAWVSTDGRTWSAHPMPHRRSTAAISLLAHGPQGFVALGGDHDDDRGSGPPSPDDLARTFWRSPDGVTWTQFGELRLDECCPEVDVDDNVWRLAVAPDGALLVQVLRPTEPSVGPYVSRDGSTWDLVPPALPRGRDFAVDHLWADGGAAFVSGGACGTCIDGIWSSPDGLAWTQVATLSVPSGDVWATASNARASVAAIIPCAGSLNCGTQLWSAEAGGAWGQREAHAGTIETVFATTGIGFVMVGIAGRSYVALASPDGGDWTAVRNEGLPEADWEDCSSTSLTGREDTLLLDTGQCGWWRGTIEAG